LNGTVKWNTHQAANIPAKLDLSTVNQRSDAVQSFPESSSHLPFPCAKADFEA